MRGVLCDLRAVLPLGVAFLLLPAGAAGDDCNQNGVDDAINLAAGVTVDRNRNGAPDECDVEAATLGLAAPRYFPLVGAGESLYRSLFADLDGDGDPDFLTYLRVKTLNRLRPQTSMRTETWTWQPPGGRAGQSSSCKTMAEARSPWRAGFPPSSSHRG